MTGPSVEVVLAEALVIRPGDRVLVTLRASDITDEEGDEVREKLRDRFPGADFTLMSGVESLAALRGDQ